MMLVLLQITSTVLSFLALGVSLYVIISLHRLGRTMAKASAELKAENEWRVKHEAIAPLPPRTRPRLATRRRVRPETAKDF